MDEEFLKSRIRDIKDYPKKGIIFRDITPLIQDREAFRMCIDELAGRIKHLDIDYIVGIEARGFIIGSALAYKLNKGFVLIRKKGKLPHHTVSKDYDLEYGSERIEMHRDSIEPGRRIFIVDDLLATGGTAKAAIELAKELGAEIEGVGFLIELSDLKGRERLDCTRIISLISY